MESTKKAAIRAAFFVRAAMVSNHLVATHRMKIRRRLTRLPRPYEIRRRLQRPETFRGPLKRRFPRDRIRDRQGVESYTRLHVSIRVLHARLPHIGQDRTLGSIRWNNRDSWEPRTAHGFPRRLVPFEFAQGAAVIFASGSIESIRKDPIAAQDARHGHARHPIHPNP